MGISDDIKPKSELKEDLFSNKPEDINEDQQDNAEDDGQISIPIDKSGSNTPVLEDLYPESSPFDHLLSDKEKKLQKKPESPVIEKKHEDNNDDLKQFSEFRHPKKRKSHLLTIFIVLFVIILAALLVIQNLDQIKKLLGMRTTINNSSSSSTPPLNSDSGVQIITNDSAPETPSGSTSPATDEQNQQTVPAANDSATNTSPSNSEPVAGTAANLSAVKLEVLNGNGISGSAAAVKDQLIAAGYTVSRLANAAKFTYATTYIYYSVGKAAEAQAIADVLSDRKTSLFENSSVSGQYDVVVVVGKE